MRAPGSNPLARAVAVVTAVAVAIALVSFLLARRGAHAFFRDTAGSRGPVHMSVNWPWWRQPGRRDSAALGPWRAWACASLSCDFGPSLQLSGLGSVLQTTPSDLARRLAAEHARGHQVAYVILERAERVRAALPAQRPEDATGALWDARLEGGDADSIDLIEVRDRGAVTVLWLPDPWDLAAATERPPRLARLDAFLRRRFAGRHIISGDALVLAEGLPRVDERRLITDAEADAFLRWLDRRPHGRWRVID